jgi:hypothetical protein
VNGSRRALIVLVMAAAFVPVGVHPAWACKCIAPPSDAQAARNSAAVFTGVAEASTDDPGTGPTKWSFQVDEVYKGDVGDHEQVSASNQSASCGLQFDLGQRYAVFALAGNSEGLHTNSCTNTRPWPDGRPLSLGGLEPHTPASNSEGGGAGTSVGALVLGAILVGAGAVAYARLRRPPAAGSDGNG